MFDLVLLQLTQLTGLTRLRRQHFELGGMDTVALQENIWPVEFDQQVRAPSLCISRQQCMRALWAGRVAA